jgi:hypothetical protein
MVFGLGLLVRPGELYRAFLRGRSCLSLYERTDSQRELSEMPLGTLRVQIGIDARPTGRRASDSFAFLLWTLAAILPPLFAVAATRWIMSR